MTITIKRGSDLRTILKPGVSVVKDWSGNWKVVKAVKAPRYYQTLLADLMTAAGNDAELRNMILQVIERMSLGWTDQNGSDKIHETANQAQSVLGNQNANASFSIMPNSQAPKTTNSIGPLPVATPKPRPYNVSLEPNSLTNPSASMNPNTQSPQVSGYGKKSYHGSLLKKAPNFLILKSIRCNSSLCKMGLTFTASDNSPDTDGDIFSHENLQHWANQINTQGLGLTVNHSDSALLEFGVLRHAEVQCVGDYCKLNVQAELNDNHPVAQQAKEAAALGRALEFSIAASPNKNNPKWSHKDKQGYRVIDDSELMHISWVSSGANRRARLIGVEN